MRYSWLLNNTNDEIKAYDYIGVCYYYQGKIDYANHYHEKMVDGIVENDANKKLISNRKLKLRRYTNNPYFIG